MYAPEPQTSWAFLLQDGEGLSEPPDPNPDSLLCRDCAAAYHEDWDAQWAEYYAGLL